MATVGRKTESIYRRYAIVDATVLREAAERTDEAGGYTRQEPDVAVDFTVPEEGIESTRGVTPTGF